MEAKSLLDTAGLLLFNSGYIYRLLRKESERLGVRWVQITLLKDIELLAPITQKELSRVNHVSGPSISIAINDMLDKGLLTRKLNPNDRRSSTLSLTKKGQRTLESEGQKLQESLLPILERLSSADYKRLHQAESALAKVLSP